MAKDRILIVDDQESIRDLLGMLCEAEGYDVLRAGSGEAALMSLDTSAFEVAILDLLLPDMHGIEILRYAKARYPDIEVIILTGHSDLQTAVEALRLGAYDYLQKPLADLQIIPLIIRRALDKQRLSRSNEQLVRELQVANAELDRRRRQQFQSIHHIGHALTGALRPAEVSQVLVEAMLAAIAGDGAGCLVLPFNDEPPRAAIAGTLPLLPDAAQALLLAMIKYLPQNVRPDPNMVVVHWMADGDDIPVEASSGSPWQTLRLEPLSGREGPLGVMVLANYAADSLGEDAISVLGILATQGSIALQNASLFARMQKLATRDSLTGLHNHGHFFELLAAEISRAERYGQEVTVIMLDIDRANGLKMINDTHGHQAGDRLLRQVANTLRTNVRQADIVARYGGDEFIIMAPQTGLSQGTALADRLRQIISRTPFVVNDHEERISVSVGVGVFHPGCGESIDTVVSMADQSCYLAKDRGGNQVAAVHTDVVS